MAEVKGTPKPERAVIGKNLEIPRMISGLWQLAGGHDEKVDIASAAEAMDPLWVFNVLTAIAVNLTGGQNQHRT